jgi:hypothetical protein
MRFCKITVPLAMLLALCACAPKTAETVASAPITPPPPMPAPQQEDLSPCPKFQDAPNPDEAETNYVLYRDFMRANDWDQAYELWRKVYAAAPAADGRRNTVFSDGITFLERFMGQTQDSLERESYIDRIFALYDEIEECYPEGGYSSARKAFDLYYNYPHRAEKMEIYRLFKEAVDKDGLKTYDFVLNPFSSLLVDLYFEDAIGMSEAKKYQELILAILDKGLEECQGVACQRWNIVREYAPVRLEAFETVKGFYDCEYYMDKYYPDFLAAQDDCDNLRTVYSRLKWGECPETDERFRELIRVGNQNCVTEAEEGALRMAYRCLQEANYNCAIESFEKAAEAESDIAKKAQYLLIIAKIYHTHLKNFPRSRQYAQQAAAVRPNWGEPYLHIGRLYASSGPLCGPGRGWDSQVVVWPAIDMWNRAKQVDAAATAEANKWIGRYSQYMPSREDIFQRNLKEGDAFFVACWIQESTRIRAATPN